MDEEEKVAVVAVLYLSILCMNPNPKLIPTGPMYTHSDGELSVQKILPHSEAYISAYILRRVCIRPVLHKQLALTEQSSDEPSLARYKIFEVILRLDYVCARTITVCSIHATARLSYGYSLYADEMKGTYMFYGEMDGTSPFSYRQWMTYVNLERQNPEGLVRCPRSEDPGRESSPHFGRERQQTCRGVIAVTVAVLIY